MNISVCKEGVNHMSVICHVGKHPQLYLRIVGVYKQTPFLSQLCDDLEHIMSRGFAVAILAGNKKSAEILAEDLRNKGFKADYQEDFETVPYGKVAVLEGNLSGGFEYLPTKFVLITESRRCSVKTVKRKKNPNAFNSLDELNKGDYVVHAVHGIGIFEGIRKIESNGIVKDYITINYFLFILTSRIKNRLKLFIQIINSINTCIHWSHYLQSFIIKTFFMDLFTDFFFI